MVIGMFIHKFCEQIVTTTILKKKRNCWLLAIAKNTQSSPSADTRAQRFFSKLQNRIIFIFLFVFFFKRGDSPLHVFEVLGMLVNVNATFAWRNSFCCRCLLVKTRALSNAVLYDVHQVGKKSSKMGENLLIVVFVVGDACVCVCVKD